VPQYLLSIYQPDAGVPDDETMARIVADLHQLNGELRDSGSWVFTGGLHAPGSATVVRADGMITDGPCGPPTPGRRSVPPHGSPRTSANATTCSRGATHRSHPAEAPAPVAVL
jgi:hypothetical protein